ncbi:MAG: hypothetical protein HY040_08005 [Planctomycetes bacterium]|nr:hypothetical protein [Planctomycetota bacterium]
MSIVSPASVQRSDLPRNSVEPTFAEQCDRFLAGPIFWLAILFLAVSAGVIHRIGFGHTTLFEAEVILWGLALLWPIFVIDGLLRLFVCRAPGTPISHRVLYLLLLCVAPPFRLGARSYADPERMWLPWIGWSRVDRALQKRLERFFSVPMIVMALLVLPLLAMEFFWLEEVRADFFLSLALDIGTSAIWMAFAVEFVLMVCVARNRLAYCLAHWMDLAVVALPLIDFLPILRLLRLTRLVELQQVMRLGRVYRLRGLLLKAWRALLLLDVIRRLFGDYKKKRLQCLRELLAAREEEIVDLRNEIRELESISKRQ